jgi:ABC-2 type transport system ATP-binding protein
MLARAILHNPSILILDEPTGAVDPVGSFELLELIRGIARERGHAVLMSSHRLDEIEALHDNVLLLDRGRTVYWGDLSELRKHWEQPRLEISFIDHAAAVASARLLGDLDGVEVVTVDDDALVVKSEVTVGRLLEMLDGQLTVVSGVREKRMRLQELFVTVLGSRDATGEEQA